MRILILLPGRPVAINNSGNNIGYLVEGIDIFGQSHYFSKFELVNNMLTIEAIKKAYNGANIIVRHMVNRNHPVQLFRAARRLRIWCNDNDIKLVHQFWGGPGAWAIARSLNTPYILSLLGSDLYGSYNADGSKSLKGRMLSFFSKLAAAKATRVVVMSNNMKNILPVTIQNKAVVIPEGISVEKFYQLDKQVCRQKVKWEVNGKVIMFFDNGNRVKNAPLAFDALQIVKNEIPNATIYVAKGIPHHELVYYYNAADLLLITSLHEGSNNSLKEALACNCPIVSTPVGDAAERLEKVSNSFAVSSFQPVQIANAIVQVFKDGNRSNGSLTTDEFSVNTIGNKLTNLYAEILANG